MPAGKRPQSNPMLYPLITFVGLFIVAATIAIIYYVKFEEQRTTAETSKSKLEEIATFKEQQNIGKLVGAKLRRKSTLGTLIDYLDEMVYLIIGGLPEDTSAEVKIDTAKRKVNETSELLAQRYPDIGTDDPNSTGLIRIIEKLKTKLDNTTNAELALNKQLEQLQNQFKDAHAETQEKEQTLLAEKEKYQQQVKDIEQDYAQLKTLMEQTSEQQVKTLMAQLHQERTIRKNTHLQLLKTQAELQTAKDEVKDTQEKLQAIVPPPDSEVAAFKPDGKIILIDEQAKIVHLNIGSDNRVYRGLTFSIYDKNAPIPRDGIGKAEIEVFNVGKNISTAQIIPSESFEKALGRLLGENIDAAAIVLSLQKPPQERARDFEEFAQGSPERLEILNNLAATYDKRKNKKPIVLGDTVANLIWDSDKTNVFVVAGEFDLDSNGSIDYGAADKIKTLIEGWGGRVDDTVSVDTDFLILGRAPKVLRKPTFEEMEIYPTAFEKYEASLKKLARYREVLERAKDLGIPIFNTDRFLYLIGHKTQAGRAGAF